MKLFAKGWRQNSLKIFKFLFILLIIGAGVLFIIQRKQIISIFKGGKESWKPTEEYIEKYNSYKPKLLLGQKEGKFAGENEKKFVLKKELEIKSEPNENVRFFLPLDIEVDDFGYVYTLDSGNQRIQIFDEKGNFIRNIDKNNGFPPIAVDISVNSDGIIAIVEKLRRRIYLFMDSGQFLGDFSVPFELSKVESLDEDFLIIGLGEYFLIHRYSNSGEKIYAFCPILQKDESDIIVKIFNEASFDIDDEGFVYLSYEYPYRIVKFNKEGIPLLAFNRKLEEDIPPPIIENDTVSKGNDAIKRTISLAIKISQDGSIYNLIRGMDTKKGNRIDMFNSEGVYLQTFYLEVAVDDFAIYRNDYIWCYIGKPENKIIKYKIEKLEL